MIAFAEQGGSWDRWTVANDYTGVMNGDPYHSIVASAYAFGARDFDAQQGVAAHARAAPPSRRRATRSGRAWPTTSSLGYVPTGAADVWGRPRHAGVHQRRLRHRRPRPRLGDSRDVHDVHASAPSTGRTCTTRPPATCSRATPTARSHGPFDPASGEGWVEGNGAQYTWMVPYDLGGLITAMGGTRGRGRRLDDVLHRAERGPEEPYAFMGNEPTLQHAVAVRLRGRPGQERRTIVRRAMDELYNPNPERPGRQRRPRPDVVLVRVGGDGHVPGDAGPGRDWLLSSPLLRRR